MFFCFVPYMCLINVGHLVVLYMSFLEGKIVHKSSFGNKLFFFCVVSLLENALVWNVGFKIKHKCYVSRYLCLGDSGFL